MGVELTDDQIEELRRAALSADRHKLAYDARAAGLTWTAIAQRLGYNDPSGAFRAAQLYARRIAKTPASPDSRAASAYTAGMAGESWESVARTLEYSSGASARSCARSYALAAGLPLPPPRRGTGRLQS